MEPRLYAAARTGTTPEEITRAVCRELADYLDEEHALYAATLTSSRNGARDPGPGDHAHLGAITQAAELMRRVGDERMPS
ncbi:hypothetical protein [Streptomyces aidingensis]|uniref:Uncharacterized protein n=1 Tax=Streptomyces aidingensis TaxID=910347 RepID=A0A1I1Q7F8_9ACTN|nr:hypothetical protein [Streptomyces aidingensis]SFD14050.1 hypothetical protein SAMN05421773_11091 [Streptomyces aidingensis]